MREHHREEERRLGGRGQGRQRRSQHAQDWRERPEGRRFAHEEGEGSWGGLGDTGEEDYGRQRYDEGYGRQGGMQQRGFGRPEPEGYGHQDQRRRGSGRARSGPDEWRQIRRDDVGVAQESYGFGGGYGREEQWGDERDSDQDWAQPLYAGPNREDDPNYGPSLGRRRGYGASEQEQAWGAGGGPERWEHAAGQQGRGPQRRGSYAGKGPRGYRRSDDRIVEDVCETLTRDPDVDASDIEVSCSGGEVTLRGTVDSRRTRRRAEECIEDLPGVRDVRNELRTQDRRDESEHASGGEPQGERGAGAPVRQGELSPGGRVVSGDKIG